VFTGLVEEIGTVNAIRRDAGGLTLGVACDSVCQDAAVGASIAVNGCCLTIVAVAEGVLEFQVVPESIRRTNLGQLIVGDGVNLERSLKVGDRLGGHFVTGHVDSLGQLLNRTDQANWSIFQIAVEPATARQMASKGSVTVDGVSLTLVDVVHESFTVALIPHTLQMTTLGRRQAGDRLNIETDILAKYVQRQSSESSG
jgi:riboflavin synthase